MILTPTWISIVTAIGAFCVSAISIFLGYKLFLARATGAFKFAVRAHGHSAGFESVAPGFAAAFGAAINVWALYKLIAAPC